MPDFIVRFAQPHEMSQVGALVAHNFASDQPGRYETLAFRAGAGLADKPGFNPSRCRVAVVDKQVVAYALVEAYTLGYGTARLRVAGIADACTHPEYRGHGYGSAVLRDALMYMAEQGAHLALLEGVGGYYERFGFSPVFPYYSFEVDSAEAAASTAPLRMRAARPEDAPVMMKLYDRHWGGRVTFLRSAELWFWRVSKPDRPLQVIEDGQGKVCGYAVSHDLSGDTPEVVADTADATLTLLAESGRIHQAAGMGRIRWQIPPDDAIVNYARQAFTVTVSARYQPSGGWMARLIDAAGLVEALLPEIIAQGQTVMGDELNANALEFLCQPDRVQIGLRRHKTTYCQLTHQDFIQVMFGSLRPTALAARPHSRLHPDSVRLLEALFPPRMAAIAGWDWF